jgi:hypothetical protein
MSRYLQGTLPVYWWQLSCQQPTNQCPDYHHRLWRCNHSCSYSCIWSPHKPLGLSLPPDTSIMTGRVPCKYLDIYLAGTHILQWLLHLWMEPGWCTAVYMGADLQRRYRPWRRHNNYQQPTVSAIQQRPDCWKQNVSLLLTRQFGKISQCPNLLHGRYLLCRSAPM